ncbi:glycoside hydrolase family 13 protein [Phytoactinopolyspora halotolerans]|uniref:Glycoside hydrolase family 13 protein n=1 Tax=Phytoactinopolyspora halotolerans TaxID=1981512 RepID=A0A6L9SHB7_9ACTN|nr:alpha-amylase family glycosyl hydrolase [Phytoactinopolyspora halotolerans]NEE04523.1 glycoside hydrolase family 13 protein [Phytoactinopolyspora halotolerans]
MTQQPPVDTQPAGWWRSAAIYQVYVRSFADGNGDGTGDLAGVRSRLPYLRDLGVDAIWFTPWYPSPMADGGYDISDYRSIDPALGTLAEAEQLIAEAAAMGIRTIVDIVPNHVSDQHPWFQAALAASAGSPERERFWFHPGRGVDGEEPPNGWTSHFGGRAWTRTKDADGRPGEWYLHLFAPEQPDLNWNHPDVRREHEEILRFWFDRGVAGVRIDSAALLVKHPELPEIDEGHGPGEHVHVDRDELHDIYRGWRAVADGYGDSSPGPRALIGEVWLPDPERMARYLRPDEMHLAFNFPFLTCPWDPDRFRETIDATLRTHAAVGAPATWVLSNHDVTRPVTRYGRADTSFAFETKRAGVPSDLTLGLRRARAAALLAMALPGAVYIYQGEELGLPEVEDIAPHRRQDPMYFRSGGVDPGRDGARVPMPWSGEAPPYGFTHGSGTTDGNAVKSGATETWLPQPEGWADLTAEAQAADPDSTLWLYRQALRIRRAETGLRGPGAAHGAGENASRDAVQGRGHLHWLQASAGVLAFTRGDRFGCVVNMSASPIDLPPHQDVLLSSAQLDDGRLPCDTTAWLHL